MRENVSSKPVLTRFNLLTCLRDMIMTNILLLFNFPFFPLAYLLLLSSLLNSRKINPLRTGFARITTAHHLHLYRPRKSSSSSSSRGYINLRVIWIGETLETRYEWNFGGLERKLYCGEIPLLLGSDMPQLFCNNTELSHLGAETQYTQTTTWLNSW